MSDEISQFREELRSLRAEITELQTIVSGLQEKSRTKSKKEFNSKIELTIQKQAFIDSKPKERTDPFNNFELVFWASYLLKDTNRKEKLDTYAEVAKRASRIKEVVKHFEQFIKSDKPKEIENGARLYTKDFLEYVLLGIPEYKRGTEMVPMTFWPAVSDWSINNNSAKISQWQRDRKLDKYDTPLEDND